MTEGPYDYAAERLDAERAALKEGRADDLPRRLERSRYSSDDEPGEADLHE